MYNYSAGPTVNNCKFIGNSADDSGGGMMNDEQSRPTVTNCTVIWNYADTGAGMASDKESSQLVTNCIFIANLADANGGGMSISGANDTDLTNSVFIRNRGTDGGAILNRTYPTIINCTFSGNLADANGGGIYSEDGNCPTLANCVLWGNTDANGCVESSQIYGDTAVINYCCVQGWTGDLGGTGNIGSNPLFADSNGPDGIAGAEDDDLHLSPGSPCIDAGDDTAVPPDVADLDGDGNTTEQTPWDFDSHPRFVDGDCNDTNIVDMGADEFPYVGDFNFSGSVNFDDFAIFALAWFTGPGDDQWNPACDISIPVDNFIDMLDLKVFAENWLAGP
jgi:predicted outer membrane repeat protein